MEYLKVTKVDDVVMFRRGQKHEGTLHLTTHHIIFTANPPAHGEKQVKRPLEMWYCYPMIERVDFNRGSAMLYKLDPQSIDADGNVIETSNGNGLANGIAESIASSSLATTASGLTSSLTSGLGFGSMLNGKNNKDRVNNREEDSEKDTGVGGAMMQLSLNTMPGRQHETSQYELDVKQRDLCRGASIRIQFRDFNYVSFDFKNILKGNDVFDSMLRLTCIETIEKLYAFIYQPIRIELQFNGWKIYDFRKEFERQGLSLGDGEGESEENIGCQRWRITTLNETYKLCESYPGKSVVPRSISDTVLGHTVKYRSKSRFPSLSYYYKRNGCSIVRCSQPLVGIKQNRSVQDENLIQEVFRTNNGSSGKNLIVDARPLTNAMAQVALGAGTEIMDGYGENSRKVFLNIENIHVMRDSLNKVKLLLKNSDVDGCAVRISNEALERTGWVDHVTRLLKATDLLVKHLVYEGVHLVVHCSDGWDRTSQVCSLVELCVDPYYRTTEGFIVLVEKEWVSFGHRFNERCGHLQRESKFYNNTESGNFQALRNLNQRFKHQQNMKFESPVFHQFLDCVYQLMGQHPAKFEFNERFLRRLVYHLYSCQYGTFLADTERERVEGRLGEKTRSVWDYFLSRPLEFRNDRYEGPVSPAGGADHGDVLGVDYSHVVWWRELFGRGLGC